MLWRGRGDTVQRCSMLSTILLGIVTPDCRLIQAQQYLFNIDDSQEQYCPSNIVASCFEPPGTICGFWLGNTPIYFFTVAHMLSVKKYRSKQSSCIQVNGPNQLHERHCRHLIQHQVFPVDI